MRNYFRLPLFVILSTFALAGVAQTGAAAIGAADWAKIVAAAQNEGKVAVYGQVAPQLAVRLKSDFENAIPGIILEYSRLVGATLISKVEAERKSSTDGADVVIAAETVWFEERAKDGSLKAPVGPTSKGWPASYMIGGAVPILSLEPFILAYNSNLVKTPITGYQDVLRPEFNGKVGTTGVPAAPVVAWYDWLEKTQGGNFLERFAAQRPRIYTGASPNAQAVAAGEIALTVFTTMSNVQPLIEQGAPIKAVVPSSSLGLVMAGGSISWSKRPNAALVLMDYLMSPRGQTAWHGRGETASPLPGIPGSLDARTINPFNLKPYTADVVKTYWARWERLFKGR